jgi:hypothetical protein
MIKCSLCRKKRSSGESTYMVVTELRDQIPRENVNPKRVRTALSFKEIAKEVPACGECVTNRELVHSLGNTFVIASLAR